MLGGRGVTPLYRLAARVFVGTVSSGTQYDMRAEESWIRKVWHLFRAL